MTTSIEIVRLAHYPSDDLPSYHSAEAAGLDLLAACADRVELEPMKRAKIPTGIRVAVPKGIDAQIRPRSGLAFNHGVTIINSPGTIDQDYRGEIYLLLINLGNERFMVQRGERVAQIVFAPFIRIQWEEVSDLPRTERDEGGFGHTGMRSK